MEDETNFSETMLNLLERYAAGRIPPLIDVESPARGLIDADLFEVYQIGFREILSGALGVLLAPDQPISSEDKWKNARSLPLKLTKEGWTGFCDTLRKNGDGNEACITCDSYWARRAEDEDSAIAYMCTHGMIDFAVPIKVDDTTIAVVFTGQLFPQPGTAWNPELIEPGGLFDPLTSEDEGVDAWEETLLRVRQAEEKYGFSKDELLDALYLEAEKEATPQVVVEKLKRLDLLGKQLSQLATAKLDSERSKICPWIRNGISHSLAQLEAETTKGVITTDFKGVTDESVAEVWQQMARYLKHASQYFGFAHIVVMSYDYRNGDGTISLLSHYGRSSRDFPFPEHYDCTQQHTSLQALFSEMQTWQTATEIDLERYAKLPVINTLYGSLRRRGSVPTYAISGRFITGLPPILVLGSLDYRRRTASLSQLEVNEFTAIGTEIGLVANICNLVMRLDEEAERQALFIEDVAHDIRNPIQNLISMAGYLQIDSMPIEAKQKKAMDIVSEVKRIDDLSRRVWVLEELRRGRLDPDKRRWVNIFDIVMRCRKSLHNRAVQNHVTIEVDRELQGWPMLRLNENLFYHTVLNLMDNAVKYSWPNTEVRVRGEIRPREYVLTFGNIGIGVPDDEKELIFKRHHRAKNARLKIRDGTGIGLSIVKVFADHYGDIEVESRPLDAGNRHLTRFHLTIRKEQSYA